ncbi:hypothetical protein GE09DRAFT_467143 [Coniochaeta sp. 2T2.1]|nr:hypothetical protein GE09DRAFT_467143 [Coniochaeta sp. 2T2.1]
MDQSARIRPERIIKRQLLVTSSRGGNRLRSGICTRCRTCCSRGGNRPRSGSCMRCRTRWTCLRRANFLGCVFIQSVPCSLARRSWPRSIWASTSATAVLGHRVRQPRSASPPLSPSPSTSSTYPSATSMSWRSAGKSHVSPAQTLSFTRRARSSSAGLKSETWEPSHRSGGLPA